MKNVLFNIAFPAEFHGRTTVEAALQLHPQVKDRLETIEKIVLTTQESAMRIINKSGPLHNPADRDHCLQYMVAVALLHGELTSEHYQDAAAQDPRIDKLRQKMAVREDPGYSRDYTDPKKRSIANAVQVFFQDGTATYQDEVHYPLGHQKRREEGFPLLLEKVKNNLATQCTQGQTDSILELALDPKRLDHTPVNQFINLFLPKIGKSNSAWVPFPTPGAPSSTNR
jgi:2-methylcitrate dehydratase